MTKTMSIRMDREHFEFLNELTKEQKSDFSKAVRDKATGGRILLAVERYKKGKASLGRAAELAGIPGASVIEVSRKIPIRESSSCFRGLQSSRTTCDPGALPAVLNRARTSISFLDSIHNNFVLDIGQQFPLLFASVRVSMLETTLSQSIISMGSM